MGRLGNRNSDLSGTFWMLLLGLTLPFSRTQMIDLAMWPGYRVGYGDEPHRQGGRLGLLDRPFVKDRPENKESFPPMPSAWRFPFLWLHLVQIFFLISPITTSWREKRNTLVGSGNRRSAWEVQETMASHPRPLKYCALYLGLLAYSNPISPWQRAPQGMPLLR